MCLTRAALCWPPGMLPPPYPPGLSKGLKGVAEGQNPLGACCWPGPNPHSAASCLCRSVSCLCLHPDCWELPAPRAYACAGCDIVATAATHHAHFKEARGPDTVRSPSALGVLRLVFSTRALRANVSHSTSQVRCWSQAPVAPEEAVVGPAAGHRAQWPRCQGPPHTGLAAGLRCGCF